MRKYLSNKHKAKGAHLQYVKNHYAKYEYKGMKTDRVTDYINQAPSKHFRGKNVSVQHPSKMRKYSWNVLKIGGAHFQCVNNHYAKLNIKKWKLLELQITQTRHPKSVADGQMEGVTQDPLLDLRFAKVTLVTIMPQPYILDYVRYMLGYIRHSYPRIMLLLSADFFQNQLFRKILSGISSE